MDLHLHAQLTAEDYGNAQIVHVGKRLPLIMFLALSTVFIGVFVFFAWGADNTATAAVIIVIGVVFSLAVSLWTAYRRLPSRLRKRASKLYEQQVSLQRPREIELTDESCRSVSERGDMKQLWNEFHKWKSDEKIVIVYSSDLLLNMFPRHWFASDADYQSLRDLLRRQIGEPGKPRKKR